MNMNTNNNPDLNNNNTGNFTSMNGLTTNEYRGIDAGMLQRSETNQMRSSMNYNKILGRNITVDFNFENGMVTKSGKLVGFGPDYIVLRQDTNPLTTVIANTRNIDFITVTYGEAIPYNAE